MGTHNATLESHQPLRPSQIADLRLAASTMTGPTRRAFQAEMPWKDGGGNPLRADTSCGWGRHTVAGGLGERRTGMRCLGAPSAVSGRNRWDDTPPEAAAALARLAEAHAQPAPTFRPPLASTRLTAQAALAAVGAQGARAAPWPAPRTRAAGLHRRGCRRRTVVKAKPPKTMAETEAMFAPMEKKTRQPRPRPASPVCVAMVKRPLLVVQYPAAAARGVILRPVSTTWG